MTPWMQIRLWMKEASRTQVSVTAVAAGLALTLLVASARPGGPALDGLLAGGEVTAGAFVDGVPVDEAGVPTGTGAAGTEAGEAFGAAEASGASGAARGTAGSTASGGGGTAAGTRTAAASAGPGAVKLTATDLGVTASTVKVGFQYANLAGAESLNLAIDLRSDMDKVIDALVEHANKTGGIAGRKFVYPPPKRKTDPLNQDDQRAACSAMHDDHKVFAVVDTFTVPWEETMRCYLGRGRPFVHSYGMSAKFQAEFGGLDVSPTRNADRMAAEYVTQARALKFIKGGEKVGMLTDACEPWRTSVRNVMIPALRAAGTKDPVVHELNCRPEAQQPQVPAAALEMKRAGVTHMLVTTNLLAFSTFTEEAEKLQWRPQYFLSDFGGATADIIEYNENQMDRMLGVTQTYLGWHSAKKPLPAAVKQCSDILVAKGLEPINLSNRHLEAVAMCDSFRIFLDSARAAGPGLTRASWANAVQGLPTLNGAIVHTMQFAPKKFSGGDTLQTIQWRRECSCWVSISDFRRGNH